MSCLLGIEAKMSNYGNVVVPRASKRSSPRQAQSIYSKEHQCQKERGGKAKKTITPCSCE